MKETNELDPLLLKKWDSGFPDFITNLLHDLYPNNIGKNDFLDKKGICQSDFGLIDIEGTSLPNQRWSILNFFDTNPMVIKQLIAWFDQTNPSNRSLNEFKKWIIENKTELFKNGDKLKKLVDLNMTSYINGTKTENYAINNLKHKFNIPSENIKQYCAGCYHDRKGGKDIEIINKNSNSKFAQIKPLISFKRNRDTFEVKTYQMKNYKKYNSLDYIIFSSFNYILIFKNEDYTVSENNGTVTFKLNSLVEEI